MAALTSNALTFNSIETSLNPNTANQRSLRKLSR